MKISTILAVTAAAAALISDGLAANYDDLVEQGYRWVKIDGPYACPSRNDLEQMLKNRTDDLELQMVEQLRTYYLVQGTLVHLVQEDASAGMMQIQVAGITTDLWTSSEFLSKLPIRDTYGIIETPETSGLIPRVTTGIGESQSDAMPEPGDTPSFGALTTPAPEVTPAPASGRDTN
jgi:hypothetical protein